MTIKFHKDTQFADRCIEYYGKVEVSRWKYSFNYNNLIKLNYTDQLNDELERIIKNLNINYFFEY